MKRSRILTGTLVVFLLALAFVSTFTSRMVKAEDPCIECMRGVQAQLEACETAFGGPSQVCYDQFNNGVIVCYATVCEQRIAAPKQR
jgi:hypothetical protein